MHSGNNVLYAFIDNWDKNEKVMPTLNEYAVVHVRTKFKSCALLHVFILCTFTASAAVKWYKKFLSIMAAHLDTPSCYG